MGIKLNAMRFYIMKYCDECGIELHVENSKESQYCEECADDWQDDMYEDFDE